MVRLINAFQKKTVARQSMAIDLAIIRYKLIQTRLVHATCLID